MREFQLNYFYKGINQDIDVHGRQGDTWNFPTINYRVFNKDGQGIILTTLHSNTRELDSEHLFGEEFRLSDGYVVCGAGEYNGILYILSYHKDSGYGEIGSFPSPDPATNVIERRYRPLFNYELNPAWGPIAFKTELFNFSEQRMIDVLIKESYDTSVDIYICDHENPNRVINSGFKKDGTPNNRLYKPDDFNGLLNQIASTGTILKADIGSIEAGGEMMYGNYYMYIRYLTADFNPTSFIAKCGVFQVYNGDDTMNSVSGGAGDMNSNKRIIFNLSDIDMTYKFIEVGFLRYYGDQSNVVLSETGLYDKRFTITEDTMQIEITGREIILPLPVSDILRPNILERACKSHTQIDNRYLGANWKSPDKNSKLLAELTQTIAPKPYYRVVKADEVTQGKLSENVISNDLTTHMQYQNYYMTFDNVGYFRGEIYAFTGGFKFKDGSESNVFPIKGKNFTKVVGTDYETNTKGIVQFPFHEQTVYTRDAKLFDSDNMLRIQGIEFDMSGFISALNGLSAEEKLWFSNNVTGIFFARAKRREWLKYQGMSIMCNGGQGFPLDIYKTDSGNTIPYGIKRNEFFKIYANNNIDKGTGRYECGIATEVGTVAFPGELRRVFHSNYGTNIIGRHIADTGAWRTLKCLNYTANSLFYDDYKLFGFIDRGDKEEDDKQAFIGSGYMPVFVHHIPMMCSLVKTSRFRSENRAFFSIRGYVNPLMYGLYSPDFFLTVGNPVLDNIKYARNCGQTSVDKLSGGGAPASNTGMADYWDMDNRRNFHVRDWMSSPPAEHQWWLWDMFSFPLVRWANVKNMEHRTDLTTAHKTGFSDLDKHMLRLEFATKVGEGSSNFPEKNKHNRGFVNQATEFGYGQNEFNTLGCAVEDNNKYWLSNRNMYTPKYIGLELDLKISGSGASIYESDLKDSFFSSKYNLDLTLTNLYENDKPNNITSWYSSIQSEIFYKIGQEINIEYDYSTSVFQLESGISSIIRYYGDCFLQRTFLKQMTWDASGLMDEDATNSIGFCVVEDSNNPACNHNTMYSDVKYDNGTNYDAYAYAHGVVLGIVTENRVNTAMRFAIEPYSYAPKDNPMTWASKPLNLEGQEQFLQNAGYNETLGTDAYAYYDELAPYEVNMRPTRIRYSFAHTPYSFLDGYRTFDINAFQDYNLADGHIYSIRTYLSNLVTIQERAINLQKHGREEVTIPTNQGEMVLGKSDYLSPYVSKLADYGTQHQFSIVVSEDGIYGVDWKMKVIWHLGNVKDSYGRSAFLPTDISKNKMIQKWLHDYAKTNNKEGSDILSVYNDFPQLYDAIVSGVDKMYDEILFSFLSTSIGFVPCDNLELLLRTESGYEEGTIDSNSEIEYGKEYEEGMIYFFHKGSFSISFHDSFNGGGRYGHFVCEQSFVINEPLEGEEAPSLNPYDYPEYFTNLGDIQLTEFDSNRYYEREWIYLTEDDIPRSNTALRDLIPETCSRDIAHPNKISMSRGLMIYVKDRELGTLIITRSPENVYRGGKTGEEENDCFIEITVREYRTLVYSMMIGAFTGEYTFGSHIYPNIRNELYSFNPKRLWHGYKHNQNEDCLVMYNELQEAVLTVDISGAGEKGLQFFTKAFDNISIQTNHIPFNYINFETENQRGEKNPFDSSGIEFWSDPEWYENKYYMPIQCTNIPNINEYTDDSQMRGTYLKVTLGYTGREQKYIKSILTEFTISEV